MAPARVKENPQTILKEINSAIKGNNHIFALFLEHSALESYLGKLFLLTNSGGNSVPKTTTDTLKRLNFEALLSLNNHTGNIDKELCGKMRAFNTARNRLVHGLIGVDFSDVATIKGIERTSSDGLALFKTLSKIYEDMLYQSVMGTEDPSDEFRGR